MPSSIAALMTVLALSASPAKAAAMKEEKPGLLRQAKIGAAEATASAQAQVPSGQIVSAEIEVENGRLLYSFDIKTKGKSGIDEVNVDASNGKVLGVQHETPTDEASESAVDSAASKGH